MANTGRNDGFKPYGRILQTMLAEAGSTIYPGDFVALASDGQCDTVAAAGDIYGCALHYATVGQKILLSVGTEQIYIGQISGAGSTAQTDVGQTYDVVVGSPSTTYRASRMQANVSSVGDSQQLLYIGNVVAPDNAFGALNKGLFKINQHQIFGENKLTSV